MKFWLLAVLFIPLVSLAASYPDAERFRPAIESFSAADRDVAKGGIVATGSSSMKGWHDRIARDLAPLTVIPRGFGGSNMYDVRYFLEELVLRHEPRAVMLYEGDNDVALGASPEQIILHLEAIVEELHVKLPKTRLYILAVKPSLARWHLWPAMQETNERLKEFSQRDSLVTFVDIATPMLGKNGKPPSSILLGDMLHMNDAGYDIWRDAVRAVLIDAEVRHE